MAIEKRWIGEVVEAVLLSGARKATKYVNDKTTLKATYRGKRDKRMKSHHSLVVTMGSPNFEERLFIKTCKKSGETFPVKKIQLRFPRHD